jgi:hypothetical protein
MTTPSTFLRAARHARSIPALLAALLLLSCGRGMREDGHDPPRAATGRPSSHPASFRDCPPEGTPGGDTPLNLLKNRDAAPETYERFEIADLLENTPDALMEQVTVRRDSWPDAATAEVRAWESKGVVVEGRLLMVRESGPESCNCRRDDLRDWHVWIGVEKASSRADAKRKRNASVIAEPTPRWQARNGWRLRQFDALARQSARVRVYGWLLFDQEHPEETPRMKGDAATRGTLWEIHPVTKIEIFTGGAWVELRDQFIADAPGG